jgi:hypothetical protein
MACPTLVDDDETVDVRASANTGCCDCCTCCDTLWSFILQDYSEDTDYPRYKKTWLWRRFKSIILRKKKTTRKTV